MRVGFGVGERSKRFRRGEPDFERLLELFFERSRERSLRERLRLRRLPRGDPLSRSLSLSELCLALSRDFGLSFPSRSFEPPTAAFRAGLFERDEARLLRRSPPLLDDDEDDELKM